MMMTLRVSFIALLSVALFNCSKSESQTEQNKGTVEKVEKTENVEHGEG